MKSSIAKAQAGFTLVEVLVATIIFAIGLLGIASHLGQTVQANSRSDVHKSAMDATFRIIEPLNQSLRKSNQAFQETLQQLNNQSKLSQSILSGNNALEQFSLKIVRAHDRNMAGDTPVNLFTDSQPDKWVTPFTVSVQVDYVDGKGKALQFLTHYVLTP